MGYLERERMRDLEEQAEERDKDAEVNRLKSITVQWYEGFQFRDTPFTVYTWKELDDFLLRVYDERVKEVGETNIHSGGYSKVKVRIEWKNGDYLEDRIDVGGSIGDYASRRDSPIGAYLKGPGVGGKPRSAMYGSSFQYDTDDGTNTGIVTETSRDNVSWTDYNKEAAAKCPHCGKEI